MSYPITKAGEELDQELLIAIEREATLEAVNAVRRRGPRGQRGPQLKDLDWDAIEEARSR